MTPLAIAGVIQGGVAAIQGISGLIGQGKAKKDMQKLLYQRETFKTPDEVYQMLNATQQNAQGGLGADVLAYLTGNADKAFSSSIGASARLGGDANDMGALFEQRMQESFKIAAQDEQAQLVNFNKFLSALDTLGKNKEAEWQSEQNLIKDKMQAVAARGANATQNLQSGINGLFSAGSAMASGGLFGEGGGGGSDFYPLLGTTTSAGSPTTAPSTGAAGRLGSTTMTSPRG